MASYLSVYRNRISKFRERFINKKVFYPKASIRIFNLLAQFIVCLLQH